MLKGSLWGGGAWGMDRQLHQTPLSYPKPAPNLCIEGLQAEGLCVARCGAEA